MKKLIATNKFAQTLLENQSWKDSLKKQPARPERYLTIFERIKQAKDVLLKKADALYWYDDKENL